MHEWTVSAHCARFFRALVRDSGGDSARFDELPGLSSEDLGDDLIRVPTASAVALWEQLLVAGSGPFVALRLTDAADIGTFGIWDYLSTCGPDLRTAFATAAEYLRVVGDADTRIEGIEDGSLYTLRQSVGVDVPDVAEAFDLMALAVFLRRASEATKTPLVPLKVTLAHRAPTGVRRHAEHFGTRNIEFEAAANSVTFRLDDVRRPLPGFQPGLDQFLRGCADRIMATSRATPTWQERFRAALDSAFRGDTVALDQVAARLHLSGRSLQRRLSAHGTTWRGEVAAAREERALRLLRETDLPQQAIASRVGYTDARTLRRAMRRWRGETPEALRAARPDTTGPGIAQSLLG
ncbi:AraC family transcriptional regulator ligand-binding domain-containing protein [Embleya sp. MST-111070]|uniref:AraC family transcriptional regulator n=1 Tax=Embleya sp. MST-111070 TaxID=3398231 RepID=UPI003F73B7BC